MSRAAGKIAPLAELAAHYKATRRALLAVSEQATNARSVQKNLRDLSRATDEHLQRLWLHFEMPSGMALLGVGGYGRGELFPYSDVDVLVLLPDGAQVEANEPLQTQLSCFISGCWDSGLEIGSSVRTVAACAEEAAKDITVQTSLLESRRIAGSAKLHRAFELEFWRHLEPQAFYTAKLLELRQRHTKYEDTPYALEPNCKESPGGLRDLQVLLWVAKAAKLAKSWDDLGRKSLATPFEVKQLKSNFATLCLLRSRLHTTAARREDRLVFDLQTAVAQSLGHEAKDGKRASEHLMRRYYWAAKAVTQLSQILLLNIEERLSPRTHELRPLNERFSEKAGMLEVTRDDLYERNPHAVLETFLLYQQTPGIKGLSAKTLRALYNARGVMDGKYRADPVVRAQFLSILQQPQGITHALRLMNQTSVLGRTLWVFRRIVGQMQHDLFHVYTVDQHILMVLRNVRRFFMPEHAHEYPLCSQLAAGWDKPWLLYAAALFHDIAKGRGGDHSDLGRVEVRRFARDFGVEKADAKLIEFLVQEHLTMSRIAQKKDLGDPQVISAFAQRVGTPTRLIALYLLTVADIRGTSPKVWNAWKGKLLEDLYRYTMRALTQGQTKAPDAGAWMEHRKTEAIKLLALATAPHGAQEPLWQLMDVGYFMRHTPDDLAWHVRQLGKALAQSARERHTIVRARAAPAGEGLQVLVYTPDVPDLFARICGFFDHASMGILDARVHTTKPLVPKGQDPADFAAHALDTFVVTSPDMADHARETIAMIEAELARALQEMRPLQAPSKARVSRRVRHFPFQPRVELQPDDKAQRWLLSVSCSDRVGLLYAIARVLSRHGVNVQLAKVSTLGERVEDTFLIDGSELQNNRKQIEIETELLEAISL